MAHPSIHVAASLATRPDTRLKLAEAHEARVFDRVKKFTRESRYVPDLRLLRTRTRAPERVEREGEVLAVRIDDEGRRNP